MPKDLDKPKEDQKMVSCQVLGHLFVVCDEKGIDTQEVLRGIPYSREHIETPANFIDWESLVLLNQQMAAFFTDEEILGLAAKTYDQPLFALYKLIGQLRFDLRSFYLYSFGADSIVTKFYPLVSEVLQDDPLKRVLTVRIRVQNGLSSSKPLFQVLVGQAIGISATIGYEASIVDAIYLDDGVEMVIHYPTESGFIPGMRRLFRLPGLVMRAGRELQLLHDDLFSKNRELTIETRELRSTQTALKRRQQQLVVIAGALPVLLWIFDRDLNTVYVSSSVERLLGYTVDEARVMDALLVLDEESRNLISQEVQQMRLAEGQGQKIDGATAIRVRQVRKDGSTYWAESYITLMRNEDDQVTGAVVISVDVDEKVQRELREAALENQLEALSRQELIGKMAGGIAHDFNNYLQTIVGFSELSQLQLQGETPDLSILGSHQEQIIRSAKTAAELVGQLLAFSKQQTISPRPLVIADWMDENLVLFRSIAGDDVQLELSIASGYSVMADPVQLQRVLINLLINATHAISGSDGRIRIEFEEVGHDELPITLQEREEPFVRLAVRDNGMGLDEDVLDKLFDPYFSTKTDGNSTGLGLAVCAGIVAQHSGVIQASQVAEGEGAVFEIFLPVSVRNGETDDSTDTTDSSALAGKKVLVVDDQEMIRIMVTSILAGENAELIEACNGHEAIEAYTVSPDIDVVLMDIVMPEMSGDVAARKLLEINPGCRILFMTGYAGNRAALDSLKGHSVLNKPFSRIELLEAMNKVIQ